jgi:hypothetical protein
MEELTSPTRRTLLTAAAAGLATPVIGAAAQPAELRQESGKLNLWVISDCHVGTDKAASEGILHGMVGFKPPPIYPETLAEALRQSENGGAFGGPPIPWDIALNLGDYAGFWDAPEDEQGREVVRQYGVMKQHRREHIYNIAGNHDASPYGAPSSRGKEVNWWFRKWADPVGEHTDTSGVDAVKRPYPIDGTWENALWSRSRYRRNRVGYAVRRGPVADTGQCRGDSKVRRTTEDHRMPS